jgi:hypothetical protein
MSTTGIVTVELFRYFVGMPLYPIVALLEAVHLLVTQSTCKKKAPQHGFLGHAWSAAAQVHI